MIIKYDNFLLESKKTDPEDFGITKYEWNNGRLDCYDDVDIRIGQFDIIPIKFGIIDGSFDCSNIGLKTLENCPEIVKDNFDCSGNSLVSFDFSPKKVTGAFFCTRTGTHTIEDYPLCDVGEHISNVYNFRRIFDVVVNNEDILLPLLNNKIAFHQMVMRIKPELIKYYTTIQPPSKKSIFMNI